MCRRYPVGPEVEFWSERLFCLSRDLTEPHARIQDFLSGGGPGQSDKKSSEGGGGATFSRGVGVQLPIPIETYITCDFPGGGGPDPCPPLDPHLEPPVICHLSVPELIMSVGKKD